MIRVVVVLAASCVVLGIVGCGGTPKDPVENLKWHVTKAIEEYNARGVDVCADGDDWFKRVEKADIASVKFDVKKTDSMVSPYEGVVVLSCQWTNFARSKTREEAEKCDKEAQSGATDYMLSYSYKDNKWQATKIALYMPADDSLKEHGIIREAYWSEYWFPGADAEGPFEKAFTQFK